VNVNLGLLMQRWPSRERPFGPLTPFAETVSQLAGPEGVAVTVFSPGDVDLASGRVQAHRYLGVRGGWRTEESALPRVVWNRYFRRDEGSLLRELQRRGASLINEGVLNKWEAHRCLQADAGLEGHLPETELLTRAEQVTGMLSRHPVVFLKPVSGSVGRGIIRAELQDDGLIRLQYVSTETGGVRRAYATPYLLDRWLTGRGRAGRFIVQEGLDLRSFQGRPADVRVLVQKDGRGRWQVTGMGARVAAPGRFTSNLHTGGEGLPVEMLDTRTEELASLAIQTARRLEKAEGPMGEFGLDFGIDTGGKIWYIEQNGQPGRTILKHLGRWDLWNLAHLRPVQYARYLATTKSVRAARYQAT